MALAGLGAFGEATLLSQIVAAAPALADSAAAVARRIELAQQSGQNLTVAAAIAQASAAGEIDPNAASLIANLAGQIASGASAVQSKAAAVGGVSQVSQWVQGIPNWVLWAAGGLLLWKVLK